VSDAEPKKITQDEKKFCAEAYHKFCGEYGLDSAALRDCMDRNGRALPHNCIEALIEPERCREAKWTAARTAVGEIPEPPLA
jgi:hypothetical protein